MVGLLLLLFFFIFTEISLFSLNDKETLFPKIDIFICLGFVFEDFWLLTAVFPEPSVSQRFLLRLSLKVGHRAARWESCFASPCSWAQQRAALHFDSSLQRHTEQEMLTDKVRGIRS